MNARLSNLGRIIVLFLLILVVCACGGDSAQEVATQAAREQAAQMAATLGLVCDGQAAANAAAYQQTTGIHPVVVLSGSTGLWRVEDSFARNEWETQALPEVQLVVCVHNEPVLIQTCPYTLQNGASVSIERYTYQTAAVLYQAQTGERLAEMTWTGSDPALCSAETTFKEGEKVRKSYGVAVGGREISAWLEPYAQVP